MNSTRHSVLANWISKNNKCMECAFCQADVLRVQIYWFNRSCQACILFIVCIKILSPVSHNSCKNKTLRSRWGGWVSRNAAQARYSADTRPQMASLWKLIFGQHVSVAPLALPPTRPPWLASTFQSKYWTSPGPPVRCRILSIGSTTFFYS